MGRLESVDSGREHLLRTQEAIGRSRSCSLRVDDPSVSGIHATFTWTGEAWMLRDATSTNGTFVDGARVEPGKAVLVDRGSHIAFGQSAPWVLIDASRPEAHAVHETTGEIRRMDSGLLALGEEDSGPWLVFEERTRSYWLETPEKRSPIDDGEIITAPDGQWKLVLPEVLRPTRAAGAQAHLDQLRAEFVVSLDEEHVGMIISSASRRWEPSTKAHHYTLLTLARHRISDESAGVGPSEAGWVDRDALLSELRMADNLLYTHIFRARKELRALGIESPASVVERRPGGLLRIGIRQLSVRSTS